MNYINRRLTGKILLVGENSETFRSIKNSVENNGHYVKSAFTASKIIEIIYSQNLDIALIDITHPNIQGINIIKKIKKTRPELEIITITENNEINPILSFMKEGAREHTAKPVNSQYLEILIQKSLERKELIIAYNERELYRKLSLTDSLTGLFNYRYFHDQLNREIGFSKRKNNNISILLLDIDDFKSVNDTFGHQTGDEVLLEISDTLSRSCREYDTIARYGGEEFGIILPDTIPDVAHKVAGRILSGISSNDYGLENKSITASIGISSFPEHSEEKDELIKKSDIALYYCKENGKNMCSLYKPAFDNLVY